VAKESIIRPNADAVFAGWLAKLSAAVETRSAEGFQDLFIDDSFWKDMLAFTWDFPTFTGQDEIRAAFASSIDRVGAAAIRLAPDRTAPRYGRRTGKTVLEGFFDFDTKVGRGTGFARLRVDEADPLNPRAWLLLTTLQEMTGFEERIGKRRPSGDEFAKYASADNWLDSRTKELAFADRDPKVLIVGGGHSGLSLAARLKSMGVDTLVIEKTPRVGDTWRNRYHSLTLHNEVFANHMPYVPFPPTWQKWLPKDKLAGWLEAYAETLELNVWGTTELLEARYDDTERLWTARLKLQDGTERTMRCPHLVMATGVSGSIPKMPDVPGLTEFKGTLLHSSQFKSGKDFAGKRAIVIGTGNSGHDVAQELYVNGAEKVSMLQRGASCVVSLEPTATSVYSVYSEGPPVDDVDLTTAAVPYPVLKETYQWFSRKARQVDKELLDRLNARGFETYYGPDDTGFHMMYLRGEGGFYIDVGCSALIGEGKIGVIQTRDMDRFVAEGLRLKDGTVVPCDLVVAATGFRNMQENVRRLLGDTVADRVGPIWGFDDNHVMRNMWQRTAQPGFWVMGGGLIDARLFSRFLALQIIASLTGILGPRSQSESQTGRTNHQAALHGDK